MAPRRLSALAFWLAASLLHPAPARAQLPASPEGLWLTATRTTVVRIMACGDFYCGIIAGMALKPTDKEPVDWTGRSQCGFLLVETSAEAEPNGWHGMVTDPRDGARYHARIWLDNTGHLRLRGYLGLPLFGETQAWTRYAGPIGTAACRLPGLVAASLTPPPPMPPAP